MATYRERLSANAEDFDTIVSEILAENERLRMSISFLTALFDLCEAESLEEAADVFDMIGYSPFRSPADELRRMAELKRRGEE